MRDLRQDAVQDDCLTQRGVEDVCEDIASSPAQSLSMQPGILSGPDAFRALILLDVLLTLSGDSVITWSPGGGGVSVQAWCSVPQSERRTRSAERWSCHRSAVGACSL